MSATRRSGLGAGRRVRARKSALLHKGCPSQRGQRRADSGRIRLFDNVNMKTAVRTDPPRSARPITTYTEEKFPVISCSLKRVRACRSRQSNAHRAFPHSGGKRPKIFPVKFPDGRELPLAVEIWRLARLSPPGCREPWRGPLPPGPGPVSPGMSQEGNKLPAAFDKAGAKRVIDSVVTPA
jgi:hypothetical protein